MRNWPYLRKSITLVYLILFIAVLSEWIFHLPESHWQWVVLGGVGGLFLGVVSHRYRQKGNKFSHKIEVNILVLCGTLVVLSNFLPVLLDFAFGGILMIMLTQVCLQLYQRKVITWDGVNEVENKD